MSLTRHIVIAGGVDGSNIGASLARGAKSLGFSVSLINQRDAFASESVERIWRRIFDKRPFWQTRFSKSLSKMCLESGASLLLTTGISPLGGSALRKCAGYGVRTSIFLSDDPFNKSHKSNWFLRNLRYYDCVFTPRRENIDDLKMVGCRRVGYVQFGYDQDLFFAPVSRHVESDKIFFAGGADRDRVPLIDALRKSGLDIRLYGRYWDRYKETRDITLGQCNLVTLRTAAWESALSICCVRKANRDGHSMRTFEIPALEVAMVVEDTSDHRDIFGPDGECVMYYRSLQDLVRVSKLLVSAPDIRQRMRLACRKKVEAGGNRYTDRLLQMIRFIEDR
jgi:spore maturation protein CgeB